MKTKTLLILVTALALGALACGEGSGTTAPTPDPEPDTTAPAELQASPNPRLIWKKQGAMARDLGRALDLSQDDLCNELGVSRCIDVHEVSLGGNDPFVLGLYEPVHDPLATTPAVMDRLLLGACSAAVERDRTEEPRTFTQLDLELDDLRESTLAVEATISILYKNILSRAPNDKEIAAVATLIVDEEGEPVSAVEFAKLACFAIGSTSEFIFY